MFSTLKPGALTATKAAEKSAQVGARLCFFFPFPAFVHLLLYAIPQEIATKLAAEYERGKEEVMVAAKERLDSYKAQALARVTALETELQTTQLQVL